MRGPVAAIDCGTNSTRLLVADAAGEPVERLMRITRLGHDVDRGRALSPEGISRTLDVLRSYRAVMDRHGTTAVRITATSAARDAANREDFFAAAEAIVGARPELLDGDEEGRLSFAGATAELDGTGAPYLVVDIGGGSTELAVGPGPDGTPIAVCSLDVGCVRLTERFLLADPPTAAELDAATGFVRDLLTDAVARRPALGQAATLVGLAGTVAALASMDQGLDTYDRSRLHHRTLTRSSVESMLAILRAEPAAARRDRPGVEPARADVIVGGAIVLAEVMATLDFATCLTSEADILDGLAQSLLAE